MEQDAQTEELYDFLYRDSARLASYYAQIFGGHLTSIEQTEASRKAQDKTGKLVLPVVGGEIKSAAETQSSAKHTIHPHDLITTDVLAHLTKDQRLSAPAEAAHGSLVLAQGTVVFVDRSMLELATVAVDMMIGEEKKQGKARRQSRNPEIQQLSLIKSFLTKLVLPSAFLLQTQDGIQLAGTIKDEGMEEPIPSYYFKHGTAGLADVFLIGIKELPSSTFTLPNTQLLGVSQTAAQALSGMMFPPGAIRVTPIALFRKL